MSEPYLGEIRLVGFNFAPAGWAACDGSLLPISQYSALFQLIGTTYGGDGQTTFAVPNLQGRIPLHQGTQGETFIVGENGGSETVTLSTSQIPSHYHVPLASGGGGTSNLPTSNTWASWTGAPYVVAGAGESAAMSPDSIGLAGSGQPHDNMMPFLVLNFVIALEGIFPSPS